MILPPGHASRVRERRPVGTRERWMIRGVLGVVGAVVVVVVIALSTAGHTSGHGCISVSLAYATGGTQDYHCGAVARALCADVGRPGLTGAAAHDVAAACRRAGLPVGAS